MHARIPFTRTGTALSERSRTISQSVPARAPPAGGSELSLTAIESIQNVERGDMRLLTEETPFAESITPHSRHLHGYA